MNNCAICNKSTEDKYCDDCKPIRAVYILHKLLNKFSINERFNHSILVTKNISNIDNDDLRLLEDYDLLTKDRFNNYTWTSEDSIKTFVDRYDKSSKKLNIKRKTEKTVKKEKPIDILDVLRIIEDNYNINEEITIDSLSKNLKISTEISKKIIETLEKEKLLKKTYRSKYIQNSFEILRYKQTHNEDKDKISIINNLKKHEKQNTTDDSKKSNKKKSKKRKVTVDKNLVSQLRTFINEKLVILPKIVSDKDISQHQLYLMFNEFLDENNKNHVKEHQFNESFVNVINTYPHIRHKKYGKSTCYNIKSKNEPSNLLKKVHHINDMFSHGPNHEIQLINNTLEIKGEILEGEYPILLNLMAFTYENIIEVNYKKENDKIKVNVIYNLENETPELWLNFIKKYNWV